MLLHNKTMLFHCLHAGSANMNRLLIFGLLVAALVTAMAKPHGDLYNYDFGNGDFNGNHNLKGRNDIIIVY